MNEVAVQNEYDKIELKGSFSYGVNVANINIPLITIKNATIENFTTVEQLKQFLADNHGIVNFIQAINLNADVLYYKEGRFLYEHDLSFLYL